MEWIVQITWWIISDIQVYFKYIFKRNAEKINDNNNPSMKIYVNKIENRITFKIKTGYYLELLTPGTMKLPGSTKSKISFDENGGNVPHSKINKVALVHCKYYNHNHNQYRLSTWFNKLLI